MSQLSSIFSARSSALTVLACMVIFLAEHRECPVETEAALLSSMRITFVQFQCQGDVALAPSSLLAAARLLQLVFNSVLSAIFREYLLECAGYQGFLGDFLFADLHADAGFQRLVH